MKTITLLTSGTRGDVQPYLALGRGLQTAGFGVVIVAPANFADLAAQANLPFRVLDGNPSDLMMSSEGSQALMGSSSVLRTLQASLRFVRAARPVYRRMLDSAWRACQGSDAIVIGLPSLWGVHIAEALRVPCIGGFVQPLTRTRAWPSAIFPRTRSLGARYNLLTHRVVEQALWQPWRGTINTWRRKQLGLPAAPWRGPDLQRMPMLYGFSERIVPRPPDWPTQHRIMGYWRHPTQADWQASDTLLRFLRTAGPVIYFGFGSPGLPSFGQHVQSIAQATQTLGARAIVSIPKGEATPKDLPAHVLLVQEVPHDWLFARVTAVVHHGGAGTLSAALHAGIPMLILPRAVDQYFWAQRTLLLGIAPPPIPQRQLTQARLLEGLRSLLAHPAFSSNAQLIAENLHQANGVQQTVEEFRKCLNHY